MRVLGNIINFSVYGIYFVLFCRVYVFIVLSIHFQVLFVFPGSLETAVTEGGGTHQSMADNVRMLDRSLFGLRPCHSALPLGLATIFALPVRRSAYKLAFPVLPDWGAFPGLPTDRLDPVYCVCFVAGVQGGIIY